MVVLVNILMIYIIIRFTTFNNWKVAVAAPSRHSLRLIPVGELRGKVGTTQAVSSMGFPVVFWSWVRGLVLPFYFFWVYFEMDRMKCARKLDVARSELEP